MKRTAYRVSLAISLLCTNFGFAQLLEKDFLVPPPAAKPRVWWHWMNGNITQEGIKKDLDWMERVGIGGFQNFDANLFTPVVVPKKLVFMTPEWKEAFRYTTQLAKQKSLEMAIAGSPGWSVTGGPWVKPEDGMKKYVWAELLVEGGKTQTLKLPELPKMAGKFQDVGISDGISGGFVGEKPSYAQDALVVAYKLPSNEKHLLDLKPKISLSGGDWDPKVLLDHQIAKTYFLPPKEIGQDMFVQYEFETPQTFKSMSLGTHSTGALAEFNGVPLNRRLKVSDDGQNFRTVASLSISNLPFLTVSFPTTTAKYWRMCFETLPGEPNLFAELAGLPPSEPKPEGTYISEFVLFNTARIDQAEDKAGFSPWCEDSNTFLPNDDDAIQLRDVVDLTNQLTPDGTLTWEVPPGQWMVLRLGYSLTGRQNHPASPEATGLEVDKLDKGAVSAYINRYLDMYQDATGGLLGAQGLQYMILDSYEAGHMNWSRGFPADFKTKRGYDIRPWLPVLTGRIVKSVAASEQFLWDFRKTIGELIVENHYEVIGEALRKRGMKRYTESHENKRIFLADGMDVKRHADIPMSAMWTPGSLAGGNDEEVRSEADIREAASVANLYGQNIAAAESMTSVQNGFSWHPEKLKRTADLEMASGLNRFVIHTSVHQALDDKKPGFSLGPFGQYFTRHETWAEAGAKAWMSYLGRSSYLLQQGKNVADILYLYGENTNITWVCREKLPKIPAGFEFDFVNATALREVVEPQNGQLVAKSGNRYSVLMLDESTHLMTLALLKRIDQLAKAGIKIVGSKPKASPSLSDNSLEFKQLADKIWSMPNVVSFDQLLLAPDVIVSKTPNRILFRHRQAEADIYWLNNRSELPTTAELSFRMSGKLPELWNPQTGTTQKVSYQIKDGRTIVPLKFAPWDAFFIVFRNKTTQTKLTVSSPRVVKSVVLSKPWKLSLDKQAYELSSLESWHLHPNDAVKYFSGTGTYTQSFGIDLPQKGQRMVLDLADVKNIAEVYVNNKNMGTIWKKPYQLDITAALKAGLNTLEVRVTNLWVNRLIGDAQAGANRSTFTTMPFYRGKEPLLPSGLVGEVRILTMQ